MHRGLHQLVWYFHNSNAVDNGIFNHRSIIIYIKDEAFQMKKQNIVLISATCMVIVFLLGSYFYKNQQLKKLGFMAKENASTFVREYSLTLGSDDAKVYIVEFFDPACETCRDFYPFVKNLMAANPGKTKLVVRYAPFHPGSDYFVKILEAARKQGKYWETLEVM